MSTADPQIVDSEEFIPILDYEFLGNNETIDKKRCFIDALREEGTVYHAAIVAGIGRVTAYRWKDSDSSFSKAWDNALEDSADRMETSVYRKALGEPDSKGRYTGGDPLLKMFWLKAHRAKFRDRLAVDVQAIQREVKEHLTALMSHQRQPIAATVSGNDSVLQLLPATNEFIPSPASPTLELNKTPSIIELARQLPE